MDSMPISTCTSPISHPDKPTFPFLKECSGDINLAPKFRQLHYPKGSFGRSYSSHLILFVPFAFKYP